MSFRAGETDDEWDLRLEKQLIKQREDRENLPDEKRNLFREREKIYRKKYRDGLSEDIRESIRKKDNQSKKKKREADKPPKRPFTDKEKFYLKPEPFESLQRQSRLKPVECAGSYIKYLFKTIQENIEQNGDWRGPKGVKQLVL